MASPILKIDIHQALVLKVDFNGVLFLQNLFRTIGPKSWPRSYPTYEKFYAVYWLSRRVYNAMIIMTMMMMMMMMMITFFITTEAGVMEPWRPWNSKRSKPSLCCASYTRPGGRGGGVSAGFSD